MTKLPINIQFYNDHAPELIEQYESRTFEQVHQFVSTQLPRSGNALDVGCGSGRDARALAAAGLDVWAVDPSDAMLKYASAQPSNVTWIKDQLPSLDAITSLGITFDFILLSAVWMHIELDDREKAFRKLCDLMNPGGEMYVLLRHGTFNDERKVLPTSFDEIITLGRRCRVNVSNLTLAGNVTKDCLGRNHVSWELVAVSKPSESIQALRI